MQANENTVLITGGASGIGFALAQTFHRAGNTVIVCGRSQDRLNAAAAALPGLFALRCDVADADDRLALAEHVMSRFPGLNVLVNNAGTLEVSDLTQPPHVETLRTELATNLVAPVALTSLLLPVLRERPAATIVNVTSGYVFLPSARTAPYCATKVALRTMTRALRYQLRTTRVRVVEVIPPAVDTAAARHYAGAKMTPEAVAQVIMRALLRDRKEVVIGMSKFARLFGRLAPDLAFSIMNRMEERGARNARL